MLRVFLLLDIVEHKKHSDDLPGCFLREIKVAFLGEIKVVYVFGFLFKRPARERNKVVL